VAKSTIGAFEIKDEAARLSRRTNSSLVDAFEQAGLQFIPENGGGAGVRLKHRTSPPGEGEHSSRHGTDKES
jgi:hypothetical protein